MLEARAAADAVQLAERAADDLQGIEVEIGTAPAAPRKHRKHEALEILQRATLLIRLRRDYRQLVRLELVHEVVFFEDLLAAPALRAVELHDDGLGFFD